MLVAMVDVAAVHMHDACGDRVRRGPGDASPHFGDGQGGHAASWRESAGRLASPPSLPPPYLPDVGRTCFRTCA